MKAKPAARILASVTLFGEERSPGDPVTQQELNKLSPNVLGALQRQGVLALGGDVPTVKLSDAEEKAQKALTAARNARAKLARELDRLRERRETAATEVADKEKERAPLLPAAIRGITRARERAETLLHERRDAEQRLADYAAAIEQTEAALEKAEAKVRSAETALRRGEAERLKDQRLSECREIERLVAELRPHVLTYLSTGRRISHVMDVASGEQIHSSWRLESVLDSLYRHVDPTMRVDDFVEAERRVLDGALMTAFQDKSGGVAA